MRAADVYSEASGALRANPVRTGLTALGIVIGIASVIAMVAVGEGAKRSVEASIESIGSNLLVVTPGFGGGGFGGARGARGSSQSLTTGDAEAIAELDGVRAVAPVVTQSGQIVARGTNTNTQVYGTVPDYLSVRKLGMSAGSFISGQHLRSASRVAVLGPTTRDDLFGEGADPVGEKVRIGGAEFTVIGVTAPKGSSGFQNQDDIVFVPLTTAQRYLSGGDRVNSISVEAETKEAMEAVQASVTALLLARHRIADPAAADFTVQNQADIIETASAVTGTFTMLLASIAAISLIVGGIGIMNMMLTTVTERTREIGLRKALGAKRGEISAQFLTESAMLTLLGGGIGVLAGWGVASLIARFMAAPAAVSSRSVLLAFAVSAATGLVFGWYPARRAANLNPIEALRHE